MLDALDQGFVPKAPPPSAKATPRAVEAAGQDLTGGVADNSPAMIRPQAQPPVRLAPYVAPGATVMEPPASQVRTEASPPIVPGASREHCPGCDYPLARHARFCRRCGAAQRPFAAPPRLADRPAVADDVVESKHDWTPPAQPPATSAATSTTLGPADPLLANRLACSACGIQLPPSSRYCRSCGAQQGSPTASLTPVAAVLTPDNSPIPGAATPTASVADQSGPMPPEPIMALQLPPEPITPPQPPEEPAPSVEPATAIAPQAVIDPPSAELTAEPASPPLPASSTRVETEPQAAPLVDRPAPDAPPVQATVSCRACGETLPAVARFCMFCAAPQEAEAVEPSRTMPERTDLEASLEAVPERPDAASAEPTVSAPASAEPIVPESTSSDSIEADSLASDPTALDVPQPDAAGADTPPDTGPRDLAALDEPPADTPPAGATSPEPIEPVTLLDPDVVERLLKARSDIDEIGRSIDGLTRALSGRGLPASRLPSPLPRRR